MGISISISGQDKLYQAMKEQIQDIEHRVDERIQQAGKNTESGAKQRAPVKTGRLRDGFEYEGKHLSAVVSNDVPYAIFVENGHRTASGSHVAARPMLNPAFEEEWHKLISDLRSL